MSFPGTNDGDWAFVQTLTITAALNAGSNTIAFANCGAWEPHRQDHRLASTTRTRGTAQTEANGRGTPWLSARHTAPTKQLHAASSSGSAAQQPTATSEGKVMVSTVKAPRPRRIASSNKRARRPSGGPARVNPVLMLVAALAVVAAVVAVAVGWSRSSHPAARSPVQSAIAQDSMATVATINGQDVPVRELVLSLGQDRAATFDYFRQQFGADDHPGFWTTTYGGQTPLDHLKKLALTDITRVIVQQQLARQHGLVADIGYAAFLQALNAENMRRQNALAQHQPVYGPTRYSEADYFTYLTSQLAIHLKDILVTTGDIPATGTLLHQYYDAHRADYQQAPFDQVKDQVEQDYQQGAYQALITQRAGTATVQVNADVLARIEVS